MWRDAIMSILNQNVKKLRSLSLMMGSTDNRLQIIKELAKSDTGYCFSQDNQGQAIARNLD
jgi:glycosyltransferase involved in cell wall biosynthesis